MKYSREAVLLSSILCLIVCMPPLNAAEKPTLYVYAQQNAFSPDVLRRFENEHGCLVEVDYSDSDDTMFEKIRRPASGYDLVMPSGAAAEQLHHSGLLLGINHRRLPNLRHIVSRGLSLFPDPEMRYHVPHTISAVCVAYNRTIIRPETAKSWGIFDLPGFEKNAAMLNDMRLVMGAALRSLGYSANAIRPAEIDEAGEILRRWKRNIALFSMDEAREALVAGELAFIQTFAGGMIKLCRENPDLAYFMPEEGSLVNSVCFAIPADAESPKLAHAFINHMLAPANAAENMNHGFYYIPNPEARELLDPDIRESVDFKVPYEIFMECESIRDVGQAADLYDREWLSVLLDDE